MSELYLQDMPSAGDDDAEDTNTPATPAGDEDEAKGAGEDSSDEV